MAHVPDNAWWYVAELIMELTVDGDPQNVVHKNLVLIKAASPEEAYQKALELGKAGENSYSNPKGKLVTTKFRGLGHLDVILDALEHGAEIQFEEHVDVSADQIKKWIHRKEELNVFLAIEQSSASDYSSGEIMNEVEKMVDEKRNTELSPAVIPDTQKSRPRCRRRPRPG